MEDKFEKKFKLYLPYIIIIAAIYLFLPILLVILQGGKHSALTEIIFLGVYPLTALFCNLAFSIKCKTPNVVKSDFFLSIVAPVVFIPTIFLYGLASSENGGSVFTVIIYLVSYFICGILGLYIGEFLSPKKVSQEDYEKASKKVKRQREQRVQKEVDRGLYEDLDNIEDIKVKTNNTYEDEIISSDIKEDPIDYSASSTEETIDDILNEIRNRHNN